MDELVKLVSQKAGITQEQARQAIAVVVGFLKDRLPAPLASQLEGLIGGEGESGGRKGLSSLLG